ncbi:MAG: hypothetical protein J6W80_01440 [Kiritimatiellae bacterium]|nr:hypothetical protein [Kiritimatiellia bacterium]
MKTAIRPAFFILNFSFFILASAFGAELYMAGDSTMCNYNPTRQYPQQGWGQALAEFMKNPDALHNRAVGGRSAKSFKAEGRWQKIVDALKPGDYVIIAFGHNDANKGKGERYSSPEDYKELMRGFAEDVRAKKATVVFATSIPHSGGFTEKDGVMNVRGSAAGLGPYVAKTIELAGEIGVPVLDLNGYAVKNLPAELGFEKSKALYMRIKPGEYKRFPDGFNDSCHIRDTGAFWYAKAAVKMAFAQELPICELWKNPGEVTHTPVAWGGSSGEEKPLKDDFSAEEIPYANEAAANKEASSNQKPKAAKFLRKTKPIKETDDAADNIKSAPLFRKTLVIIGDSYVQNHRRPAEETWHYRLAEKYQMQYFNYGRNGNTLVIDRGPKGGTPMLKRYGEMHSPADYVVVIAGHNDACNMKLEDPASLETFRDGVKKFVDVLKKKYPGAKIVFVSPWGVNRKGFAEVLDTYRELLPGMGVAFYDAARDSGIDPNDEAVRSTLFQAPNDTAHLNIKGHALMLEKMEPFFLSL